MQLVQADLARKHAAMERGAFELLRATYYRWGELWDALGGDARRAPRVLAVGDLHVENFGTWRDAEGRLVWGVNDFDEVARLPYTNDLVRLATSAVLAARGAHLSIGARRACAALLDGYHDALAAGGRPFVLAEEHRWLRRLALGRLRDPLAFWTKLEAIAPASPPREVAARLRAALPPGSRDVRFGHRVAGLGSLGRPRWVALALHGGARVAREAKPLLPPSSSRAKPAAAASQAALLLARAVRVGDPWSRFDGGWLVRRLAPDCARIDLAQLDAERDEARLLHAMGAETANVHLGTRAAVAAIGADLDARPARWLESAGDAFADAVTADAKAWRARALTSPRRSPRRA